MGQVCNKNSKSGKPIRLPENDMPYINVEESKNLIFFLIYEVFRLFSKMLLMKMAV